MSVLLKMTGYNLVGGTETIFVSSRVVAKSGLSDLDFFNTRSESEYCAVRVECVVVEERKR